MVEAKTTFGGLPVVAAAAGALLALAGCAGTNVGSEWQCPMAQGKACVSIAGADPAIAGTEPGTVIETEVAGFVAGSGKAGVRGPVVSREGALVEKAFLAGMVSGVGQGVAGAFQPQAVASGGAAVANTALGDIGRAGLGAGASTAGRRSPIT